MKIERAVTVNIEAAHSDERGRMHGHSYLVECWTDEDIDLPLLHRYVQESAAEVDHSVLESSIGGNTMEALGQFFLARVCCGDADRMLSRVVVRRPTLGYVVEVRR